MGVSETQDEHPGHLQDASTWELLKHKPYRRALITGCFTLTLAIMGSAILPIPWAFSVTGISAAMVTCCITALANVTTCDMLLHQTYKTGARDYESLGYCIGGWPYKIFTEVSVVILLYGTLLGSTVQLGEAGSFALSSIPGADIPCWISGGECATGFWQYGRFLMIIILVCLSVPWIFAPKLTTLEYAGWFGFPVVMWLVVTVVVGSIKAGLPAIADKTFPASGWNSELSSAVSTFGFAYYIQPIMMPMLSEMPPGKAGVKLTSLSMRMVVMGSANIPYLFIGFFGAAWFGLDTQDNILQNTLYSNGDAQAALNIIMVVYLAFAIPPFEYATRHTIDNWIPGPRHGAKKFFRHLALSALIYGSALGIGLAIPNDSGKVITLTGATGVMLVSYLIPVVNHFILFFNRAKCQRYEARGGDSAHSGVEAFKNPEDLKDKGAAIADPEISVPGDEFEFEPVPLGWADIVLPMRSMHRSWPLAKDFRTSPTWTLKMAAVDVVLPLAVLGWGMYASIATFTTFSWND